MSEILLDNSNVIGHIYIITNTKNDKCYVGQTLSHRKNRGKYRPFGYEGRFKDHISEALCNSKKKQCTYLNNAIRLYGKESFNVSLITTCSKDEIDKLEQDYIEKYNSLYPNGYNLTKGGKNFKELKTPDIEPTEPLNIPAKRGGCKERTPETRAKMSKSLKEIFGTEEMRTEQMKRTQTQHYKNKLQSFVGVEFDLDNPDKYLRIRTNKNNNTFIKLIVGNKQTSFVGKYEPIEELKNKAIEFMKEVNNSATLPNCSGNP